MLRLVQCQPRFVHALVFASLFVLIAWLDLVLDHDRSLFALYLIPTLYSAWFLGIRWGRASSKINMRPNGEGSIANAKLAETGFAAEALQVLDLASRPPAGFPATATRADFTLGAGYRLEGRSVAFWFAWQASAPHTPIHINK